MSEQDDSATSHGAEEPRKVTIPPDEMRAYLNPDVWDFDLPTSDYEVRDD